MGTAKDAQRATQANRGLMKSILCRVAESGRAGAVVESGAWWYAVMPKNGPRNPRMLVDRIGGSAVGYKCVAPGCTWRTPATLRSEAEDAFAKHLQKMHPKEPAKKKSSAK
jgi:hypothetical protein